MVKDEEKKSRDEASEVMIAAVEGLTMITNQQFGTSAVNWDGWWKQNKNKPLRVSSAAIGDSNTGTVVDHLSGLRKKGFAGLEKAPKKGIVVISAAWRGASSGERDSMWGGYRWSAPRPRSDRSIGRPGLPSDDAHHAGRFRPVPHPRGG